MSNAPVDLNKLTPEEKRKLLVEMLRKKSEQNIHPGNFYENLKNSNQNKAMADLKYAEEDKVVTGLKYPEEYKVVADLKYSEEDKTVAELKYPDKDKTMADLKYLEEVPPEETLWEGECFVFDERVTVNLQLEKGNYDQCNACRLPITQEDKISKKYEQGVSCPHCYDKVTDIQKSRFMEREKQMALAKQRGEAHIGADAAKSLIAKREAKLNRQHQLQQQQ